MTALTPEQIAVIRERWDRSRVATTLERPRHVFDDFDALLADGDRLRADILRLDAHYKELLERAEAAKREIAEALQLDGGCETLSELVAGCFEARVERDRYKAVVEAALEPYATPLKKGEIRTTVKVDSAWLGKLDEALEGTLAALGDDDAP